MLHSSVFAVHLLLLVLQHTFSLLHVSYLLSFYSLMQRWNPIDGFSGVLLPSDRPNFSSADGLTVRTLSSITLPTLAWSWESHWHLHHTHEGQALDKEVGIRGIKEHVLVWLVGGMRRGIHM